MSSSAFVSFLDVLGFKDLVRNNSHDDLVRKYENLFAARTELGLTNASYRIIERKGRQIAVADG